MFHNNNAPHCLLLQSTLNGNFASFWSQPENTSPVHGDIRQQPKEVVACWSTLKTINSHCFFTNCKLNSLFSSWCRATQGLYCDIRQLVQFIKEAHGNVFRRVALSALLDSAEKLIPGKKTEETEQEQKPSGSKRLVSGREKAND